MDFSQLPKMSKTPVATDAVTEAAPPPDAPQFSEVPIAARATLRDGALAPTADASRHGPPLSDVGFGSIWISVIASLILLALGATFIRFLVATLRGQEFSTGWLQPDGVTAVKYFELQGGTAWSDMSLFLMGVALLLDAALLTFAALRRRSNRPLVIVALAITAVALIINAGVVFYLFSLGITPLTSLVALMVGGFVVFDHAPMLKRAQ